MEQNNKTLVNILTLVAISLVVYFFVRGIDSIFKDEPTPVITEQPNIKPEPDPRKIEELKRQKEEVWREYQGSEKIDIYPNGLVTPKSLVTACEDNKKNQDSCNEEVEKITEIIRTSGSTEKAYLYVKTGVSRNGSFGPLTQYDSLWFYITNDFEKVVTDKVVYGGHLLRSEAIINRETEDGLSEILFDLSKLPVTYLPYSDGNNYHVDNILEVLNRPGRHFTGSFVSTLGIGQIYEIKIGYLGGLIEKIKTTQ